MRVHPGRAAAKSAPPRVSVVIPPCYNYGRYLTDAVGSALAQDGVEVDVTILDDASTDDSVETAERLATSDARVRLVRHAVNRGHVETSNEVLTLATGEFVVKLDADDLLTPGSLARSAALMRDHPEVVLCYGYAEQFYETRPTRLPDRVRNWSVWRPGEWTERVMRRGHNPICQPEAMVRRDALEASGGYRPELRWAEDFNLWLRLSAEGAVGRVNGPTQGLYRMHPHSFTRSAANPGGLTDVRARAAAVDLFFAEFPNALENSDGIHRAALSALANDARRSAARVGDADAAHAEYLGVARELDARSGLRALSSPAMSRSRFGAVYRDLEGRISWRYRRRYGI